MNAHSCFVTGATGLLGRAIVARLLDDPRVDRVYVLVRTPLQTSCSRVIPVPGDLLADGLRIPSSVRTRLADEVGIVVHAAATTSFSQSLDEARATNRDGTQRLLEVTSEWTRISNWVYVSSAFVAGLRTGLVGENENVTPVGWANAYEQSKFEAEAIVRGTRRDWAIARPATIVCDDVNGAISQTNAVHRALRLYFGGLAAMLPGVEESALDVVTTDYCARGIACVALAPDAAGRAFHFCAGRGAMPLQQLLDASYDEFQRAPAWRRKGIARPVRTDLETYRIFESAIEEVGSDRVRQAVRSLGHFVPQLAFPKVFDTTGADALLGECAPPVASFWMNMVAALVGAPAAREAA